MSSPVIVLQAGFSARPSLQRRTARPEFYKPSGKFYFWEFFSSRRGFRQFVGCTWQVFLCFQGEDALLACLQPFREFRHHIIVGPILPLNLAVPSTRIRND